MLGFRGSLTRVLKAFIKKENAKKTPTDLLGEDVREGITAITVSYTHLRAHET
mgnify:CR=1 FL=1